MIATKGIPLKWTDRSIVRWKFAEFHTNVGHEAGNEVAVANSISLRDRRFNSFARSSTTKVRPLGERRILRASTVDEPSVSRMLTETFARFSSYSTTCFSANVDRCVKRQKEGHDERYRRYRWGGKIDRGIGRSIDEPSTSYDKHPPPPPGD